jgi:hypothetical protein
LAGVGRQSIDVRHAPVRSRGLDDRAGPPPPRRLRFWPILHAGFMVCDTAAPSVALMLHLRARYVSKAAILGVPGPIVPVKIEVSFEFQGLGSLGAARGDGFSLASLTA